jgi:ribosomal silencing factor RsfS
MSVVHVDDLKKLVHSGDEEVKKELLALLRNYEIPEEYADEVRRRLKELIREEVRRRGLPEEEWLIDALYRILIHMAYATL